MKKAPATTSNWGFQSEKVRIFNWLPTLDVRRIPGCESLMRFTLDSKLLARQKWCWLRVPFYRRRRKRVEISIGEAFPEPAPKPVKHLKNIARFALGVKAYLASNPGASHSDAAKHFKVTRPRISQLLKIASNLPELFLKKLAETDNPILLKKYSGKNLLKIASLSRAEQQTLSLLKPYIYCEWDAPKE